VRVRWRQEYTVGCFRDVVIDEAVHLWSTPSWGLDEEVITPHRKRADYYEVLHRVSEAGSCGLGNEPFGSVRGGHFMTIWVSFSLSRRALLRVVSYGDCTWRSGHRGSWCTPLWLRYGSCRTGSWLQGHRREGSQTGRKAHALWASSRLSFRAESVTRHCESSVSSHSI